MSTRKIIEINEELCDGCGDCVVSCAENAIEIIDGKAKLIKEQYCDGLGACLGDCPTGALSIVEREAPEFDEKAVEEHILKETLKEESINKQKQQHSFGGCPGSAARMFNEYALNNISPVSLNNTSPASNSKVPAVSKLKNWPIQINLMPVMAPYLKDANLLIAADCVPFAMPGFHSSFLEGKILMIGCPKLDDSNFYVDKLSQVFKENTINSIDVAIMEVPCCSGLMQIIKNALDKSGKNIPLTTTVVSLRGEILNKITE